MATALTVAFASACTDVESFSGPPATPGATRGSPSPTEPPAPRVIAFSSYLKPRPSFYAAKLTALDAKTFDSVGVAPLRLGDAVTEAVADPDGRLLALGGYNFGKVILVDPVSLEVAGKVEVAERDGVGFPQVHVVDWPATERLLGYAEEEAAHHLLPGRAFVADPAGMELVKSVPLRGSVMAATATQRGVAFLVASVPRVGPSRVVLMDTEGELQTVTLRKIDAGYVDPGTPGDSLLRGPALVALGENVYVIGASEPVAEVDIRTGRVEYHRVPGLMEAHNFGETNPATGTAGALEVLRRDAFPLGRSRLLVTGDETQVVRGGSHLRDLDRVPQVVDVRDWRVRHSFEGLRDAAVAGRLVIGRSVDGKLVALEPNGTVLFRRPGRDRSWLAVGDRLFEEGVNSQIAVELHTRTGRQLRSVWLPDTLFEGAVPWPPRAARLESVTV